MSIPKQRVTECFLSMHKCLLKLQTFLLFNSELTSIIPPINGCTDNWNMNSPIVSSIALFSISKNMFRYINMTSCLTVHKEQDLRNGLPKMGKAVQFNASKLKELCQGYNWPCWVEIWPYFLGLQLFLHWHYGSVQNPKKLGSQVLGKICPWIRWWDVIKKQ